MKYTLQTLKAIFETLANSSYNGVRGVLKFEGNIQGPTVGITICTHGNEPGGLSIANFLSTHLLKNQLLKGTLYLVLNNLEATRRYFSAETEQEQSKARYVDINMNRLPENTLALTDDTRYEIRRAQELARIWNAFDIGLDIHSMTSPVEPMLISKGSKFDTIEELIQGFPISILVSNIDRVQLNLPVFAFYGRLASNIPAFAVETGQHVEEEAFARAVECAKSLLQNVGMLPSEQRTKREIREYRIEDSILFPNLSFDLVRDFRSYDVVKKGDLLAKDDGDVEIRAPFDGHLIFPTERRGQEKDISEEVAFLSRPVTVRG